jgi:hypothetical protein
MRYDHIIEVNEGRPEEIEKFNPFHDELGRFSTANAGISFTTRTKDPSKQHWANMAIAREKERTKDWKDEKSPKKPETFGNTEQQTDHKPKHYNNLNHHTMESAVAFDLGVSKEESKRMIDGIRKFSDGYYSEIRAASTGVKNGFEDKAKACDEFIEKSPKWAGGQLYRGVSVTDNELNDMLKNVADGKPIDMRGVSSFSSKESIAQDFSDMNISSKRPNEVIFVTNGKSTNYGTSIKHISGLPHENEVLVSAKAVFTPTKVEKKGGYTYIYGDMP